jgi:hypothetical protein
MGRTAVEQAVLGDLSALNSTQHRPFGWAQGRLLPGRCGLCQACVRLTFSRVVIYCIKPKNRRAGETRQGHRRGKLVEAPTSFYRRNSQVKGPHVSNHPWRATTSAEGASLEMHGAIARGESLRYKYRGNGGQSSITAIVPLFA